MLETMEMINLVYYLLLMLKYYLSKIDGARRNNLLTISSKNNNIHFAFNNINKCVNIQSAENCKGFSETIRQLSNSSDIEFYSWLAGIIDGDGNFDIRKNSSSTKPVLKAIRIKLHNRDVRILTRIKNYLHMGRIRTDKNKPYSLYIISIGEEMYKLISKLNGLIRIKVDSFKLACDLYNISFKEANYTIQEYDPYFAGLVETDGSIVFNFNSNRIECNLEFKYNNHTSKLSFYNVIPNYKPYVLCRNKTALYESSVRFKSIAWKFQTVKGMILLYDYFLKNRLYSDFKFYRVTQIKRFIEIRDYKNKPFESTEYQIYSNFLLKWIQYKNPLWNKTPFLKKLRIR